MRENNFNPGLKESNNFLKNSSQIKIFLKITKHTRIPDTMNESQYKQETAELDHRFFNRWKEYITSMFSAIEKLKI